MPKDRRRLLQRRTTRPAVRAVPTVVRPARFLGGLIRRVARRAAPIIRR